MKKSFLLLVFLLTAMFVFAEKPKPQTVKIKTSAICEMCKDRIERQMAFTKGVTLSELNLDDKVLTVTFLPKKTDVAKIKKAITEVGYDADEVVAETAGYEKLPSCCKKGSTEMKH
jgi:periplasmic mercuric ion binding protein